MKTNKTFADLAKNIQSRYKGKEDSIGKRSMERELSNLMMMNEQARVEEESTQQFKFGGKLPKYNGGGTPWFKNNDNPPFVSNDEALTLNPITYNNITSSTIPMTEPTESTDLFTKQDRMLFAGPGNEDVIFGTGRNGQQSSDTGIVDKNTNNTSTGENPNFMTAGNYLGLGTAALSTIGDFALAAKNKPRYVKNYFRGAMNPAINETKRSMNLADRAMTAEGRMSLNKVLGDASNNSLSNSSRIANMSSILSNYNNQSGIGRAKLRSEFTGRIGQLLASQGQMEGQGEFMRQQINTQEEDAQRQSYADAFRNLETRGYNSAQLLNKNTQNQQLYGLLGQYYPNYQPEYTKGKFKLNYKK